MTYMLGRQIPLKTARKGGYFFTMAQDGNISATLDLANYFDTIVPDLPTSTNWLAKSKDAIKQFYKNNQLGCCVISSLAHLIGVWTANATGTPVIATDAEIVALYRIWNPRGDNGCDIATVNKYWRDHGAMIGGQVHKIDSFIGVDWTNKPLVKAALALFANIKLGIDLPDSWHGGNDGDKWDITNSRIIGGHDVPAIDYYDVGDAAVDGLDVSTWAGTRRMLWRAVTSRDYIKEAYSILSPDWYSKAKVAPNGVDVDLLKADQDALANGQIPSVGPPSVPIDWLI